MAEIGEQFIKQFHSLAGDTVKEKHQNSFRLLHQHHSLLKDLKQLAFVVENLKPLNHLEYILYVDFLIYFQVFPQLYKNFMKGDEVTVKKLSKQDWFYLKAFKEVSCDEFVNTIMPTTSLALKLKILKKLPMSEKDADEFFDAVSKRYGVHLATVLLPKCTSPKILEVIKSQPIKLSPAQLQIVYDKDPHLVEVYLEERTKLTGSSYFMNNNPILKYMAQKNPEMFSKLFEKYRFQTNLGRRVTKKYIAVGKDRILDQPQSYFSILDKSATVRKMGSEITNVFVTNRPEEWKTFSDTNLKYFPKKQQFSILKSVHDSINHEKFGENVDLITEDVLKMVPDSKQREALTKLKMEKEDLDWHLKYLTPQCCIETIMEKLNYSSTLERVKYVELATENCLMNKDAEALLKVFELVCVRFKNDDRSIRQIFFNALTNDRSRLNILDERHWKYVNEVIATAKAKDEWVFGEDNLMIEYVKFLSKNNIRVKDAVIRKNFNWCDFLTHYYYYKEKLKPLKKILLELIEIGMTYEDPDDELADAQLDCSLVWFCHLYNKDCPDDIITQYNHPRIMKSIERLLQSDKNNCSPECIFGVNYFICQPTTSQGFKKLYFASFDKFGKMFGLMWFLKKEPKTLSDNWDQFLNLFVKGLGLNTRKLWRLIKKYSHLDLDQRAVEYCRQKLTEEGYEYKVKLIRPLSILSPPDSHLELVKLYIPVTEKVDLTDQEVRNLYFLQGKLLRLLHLVNAPKEVLEATFDFCKGDYLQFALTPLYSCTHRLPENETLQFIEKLSEIKALSVKKHAMKLTCVIYNIDAVYNYLKLATVPSLVSAVKYFAKNPSESLWNMIENQIKTLTKNQLLLLTQSNAVNIPNEYKSRYAETVWKIVDKHDNKELNWLVQKFDQITIEHLDSEFVFKVVTDNIFHQHNVLISNILIYFNSNEKATTLSTILSNFKKTKWNHPKNRRTERCHFSCFVTAFFEEYMKAKDVMNKNLIEDFERVLGSTFTLTEAFQEFIFFKCMTLKGEPIETWARVLSGMNRGFIEKYGTFATILFTETIDNFVLNYAFKKDEDRTSLCHALMKLKQCDNDYLLIINLLPKKEPVLEKYFVMYQEIVEELGTVTDEAVQLLFNLYLRLG